MPIVHIDSEGAALVEAACAMLEAALTARVERADPEGIISNSLILQSHKLSGFREGLRLPDPPPFGQLPETLRRKALRAAAQLSEASTAEQRNEAWELIRALTIVADVRRRGT